MFDKCFSSSDFISWIGCSSTLSIRPRRLALSASKNRSRSSNFSSKDKTNQMIDLNYFDFSPISSELCPVCLTYNWLTRRFNFKISSAWIMISVACPLEKKQPFLSDVNWTLKFNAYLNASWGLMNHYSSKRKKLNDESNVDWQKKKKKNAYECGNEWRRPWVPDVNSNDAIEHAWPTHQVAIGGVMYWNSIIRKYFPWSKCFLWFNWLALYHKFQDQP